jgi:hypothetical protein
MYVWILVEIILDLKKGFLYRNRFRAVEPSKML